MEKELLKFDKKDCIINFDEFREILNSSKTELKENYIEYLIFKMKTAIAEDENRLLKIEYLNYQPLKEILQEINIKDKKEEKNNDEEEENEESSLDEEDLMDGIDKIQFKMQKSNEEDDVENSLDIFNSITNFNNFTAENNKENLKPKISTIIDKNIEQNVLVHSSTHKNDNFKDYDYKNGIEYNNSTLSNFNQTNEIDLECNNVEIKTNHSLSKIAHSSSKFQENEINKKELEDFEISLEDFKKRNEKIFYSIAKYLISNKRKVSDLFDYIENNNMNEDEKVIIEKPQGGVLIRSEEFFSILESMDIDFDMEDQYCIILKLSSEEAEYSGGSYIEIDKLKDEMMNYGVFDESEDLESINNQNNKKYTNNFYVEKNEVKEKSEANQNNKDKTINNSNYSLDLKNVKSNEEFNDDNIS